MKKNSKKALIVLLICVAFNAYLMINNVILRCHISDIRIENNDSHMSEINMAHMLHTVNDNYQNCGLRLDNIVLTDILSHQSFDIRCLLDSIGEEDVIMVCRFSQHDCERCVSYAIEKASEFAKKQDATLFIWGCHDEDIVLKALKNRYDLSGNVRWYNVPEMDLSIEQHGNPYYMVLNKGGVVIDFFTPDKMDPKMTDRYFGMIEEKWKNNNCNWY